MSKPARISWNRHSGQPLPQNARLICRPGIYGNLWRIGDPGAFVLLSRVIPAGKIDREAAVDLHYRWLAQNSPPLEWLPPPPQSSAELIREVTGALWVRKTRVLNSIEELRDRDLACSCGAGKKCHGDILLRLAAGEIPDDFESYARAMLADGPKIWI